MKMQQKIDISNRVHFGNVDNYVHATLVSRAILKTACDYITAFLLI